VGSISSQAVSRLPGPPLEDPPTSPPHLGRGRGWGERGGTTGARAASQTRRRSVATGVTARLAPRLQRSRPTPSSSGGPAAAVPPRQPSWATDWRGGRDAVRQQLNQTEPNALKDAPVIPAADQWLKAAPLLRSSLACLPTLRAGTSSCGRPLDSWRGLARLEIPPGIPSSCGP
jgi:hypothetical protein